MQAKEGTRSMESHRRVFAVGLDGATLDLIRPWAAEGKLPAFAKIMNEGAFGRLISTILPVTGPAWVSFMTGKNPGKHGVGDFMRRMTGDYRRSPIDSSSVRATPLWVTAGLHEKKVGILNVPVTYPPYEVNGFMVSGLLTPRRASTFTYPERLAKELEDNLGSYRVNLDHFYAKGIADRFLDDLRMLVDMRTRAAEYLMNEYEWDFFMVHYIATDWVQHFLWHCMDRSHPRFDEAEAVRYGDSILEIYQRVDAALSRLMEGLSEDVVLLVMSDHGFGPFYKYVYLNNWLLENKLLQLKKDLPTRIKRLLFRLGLTPSALYRALARMKLVKIAFRARKGQRYDLLRVFFLSAQDIDWAETKAYSMGNVGQIFINLKGREPQGIVEPGLEYEELREQIMGMLVELQDPETGHRVVEHVHKREEVYSGDYVDEMADILVIPKDFEYVATGLSEFVSNAIMEPSFAYTGMHRKEGIFMLRGNGLRRAYEAKHAEIVDMAPTVLHLLGLPIPRDMDGRVLTEVFDRHFLALRPVEYTDEAAPPGFSGTGLSEDEAEEVRERLRGLGYAT
jgi:predicted AlkP superfamily phosphohydrolase/phosphomutase